jgi:cell wall assembly regulator SMI1
MKWVFRKESVSIDDLRRMESHFRVTLPQSYVQVVLNHHGGRPRPGLFDTDKRRGNRLKTMLPITRKHKVNVYDVKEWLKERLHPDMVPIANDEAGNYLCLRYPGSNGEPSVVLWNHEKDGENEQIKPSFASFLNALY